MPVNKPATPCHRPLDFRNEEDEIFKSFKPYYQATPVGENIDPQKLNAKRLELRPSHFPTE